MVIFVQQVFLLLYIKYNDEVNLMDHLMDHMYMLQLLEQLNHQPLLKKKIFRKKELCRNLFYHNPKYEFHIQNKHHNYLQLPYINS